MSDEMRIVLIGEGKRAHDKMLEDVRADKKVTINPSKLINWIVQDYFENFYERRRKQIIFRHMNSRKYLLDVVKQNDPTVVRKALREFAQSMKREFKETVDFQQCGRSSEKTGEPEGKVAAVDVAEF